jgi:soluble lytic murein transglycosylase-like protein
MAQPGAGTRATDAQFRLAFVQFRQGAFELAANGWRDLTGRVSGEDRAQALFWLGKALSASGDGAAARTAWTGARDADPRGFYGLRAVDLLEGRGDPRASLDAARAVVQKHAADLQPLPQGLAVAERADALLGLGLRQPAIWELQAVADQLTDASALAQLGAWEQRRGLYNTALLLGYGLRSQPGSLLYPLVHPDVLARLDVDPLLFSALMLQESNLDQDVESAAQARGLSQLIASTAYEAARALGVYSFRSADLFRPQTSIQLGAYTFGRRLARYEGRVFPALAAYNASQFAVDGWLLAASTADVDTFAEAIPFTETYPYVQRIYVNYRQYLDLYQ